MKNFFLFLFVLIFLSVGFLSSGPFLTLYLIKESIEEKNSTKLSKNIYFPELKSNIKVQINSSLSKSISEKFNDNPIKFLAKGLGDIFIDEVLDVFLTPDGLERLINGENPSSIIKNKEKSNKNDDQIKLFESFEFKYQSLNRFIVFINTKNGKVIMLHLDRFGLRWKLVNIILP